MPERLRWQVGDEENGQLVQVSTPVAVTSSGITIPTMDFLWKASFEGKVFIGGDADQNDMVTAQTSFANTTPTFCLDVPTGTTAIPLFVNLSQSGTVAGGDINVLIEIDKVKRFSSGTAETSFNTMPFAAQCGIYSTVTAVAGYGMTVFRATLAPDVSPAEGAVQGPFWRPDFPIALKGPASLLIYTYAASTAPTWLWNIGWVELSDDDVTRYINAGLL